MGVGRSETGPRMEWLDWIHRDYWRKRGSRDRFILAILTRCLEEGTAHTTLMSPVSALGTLPGGVCGCPGGCCPAWHGLPGTVWLTLHRPTCYRLPTRADRATLAHTACRFAGILGCSHGMPGCHTWTVVATLAHGACHGRETVGIPSLVQARYACAPAYAPAAMATACLRTVRHPLPAMGVPMPPGGLRWPSRDMPFTTPSSGFGLP
jgi:hypothetical protein